MSYKKIDPCIEKAFDDEMFREIEVKLLPYNEANELLKQNGGKMEDQQWGLAKAEDTNIAYGYVFLARRERITK